MLHLPSAFPPLLSGHWTRAWYPVQGVSGFLKKSDIAEDARPKAGALLDVVVRSAADKRLVTVTAAPDAVAAATLKDDAATDLGGSWQHPAPATCLALCAGQRTDVVTSAAHKRLQSFVPFLNGSAPWCCRQPAARGAGQRAGEGGAVGRAADVLLHLLHRHCGPLPPGPGARLQAASILITTLHTPKSSQMFGHPQEEDWHCVVRPKTLPQLIWQANCWRSTG